MRSGLCTKRWGWLGVLAIAFMILWPAVTEAEPLWDPGDLPAAVRLVLGEAGELMNQQKYGPAIEKLLAFEARGRSAGDGDRSPHAVYSHPMIHFALGNAYLLQADAGAARNAFERAVARHPDWVPAWLNLAKAHYDLNAPGEAARCFYAAYEKGGHQNPEHLYLGAAALLMDRQYEASVARFDQLLAHHPDHMQPEWREHLVHALLSSDQPRRALPHIRLLARMYEGDKRIQWQEILLHQYMHLEMHAEALTLVRILVNEAPTLAKWWKAKAHLHLNTQSYAPALVAMTIYGFLSPLSRDEQRLLADLRLQLGIPGQAVPVYETLLAEGADKRLLQNLVTALRQVGRPDAALRHLEAYPDPDSDLLMLRADLLYALEQYADAAEAYRRAAGRNTRQAGQAWLMAGYAAWQIKDLTASRRDFQRAADYDRQRQSALQAMRRLEAQAAKAN